MTQGKNVKKGEAGLVDESSSERRIRVKRKKEKEKKLCQIISLTGGKSHVIKLFLELPFRFFPDCREPIVVRWFGVSAAVPPAFPFLSGLNLL